MNIEFICKIFDKRVVDMTDGESAVMEFFLRYHPDAFAAIEACKAQRELEASST